MTAPSADENDLDSLTPIEPQPTAVRDSPRAVRTVTVPDPGYEPIPYTKCRCGKWFHTGWFQLHDCAPKTRTPTLEVT